MDRKLLGKYFPEEDLYQIDANNTGMDISHYDEMVIYSNTFSGANFTQVLSRMVNISSDRVPEVYVYMTKNTVEEDLYKTVISKKDSNEKFLRS